MSMTALLRHRLIQNVATNYLSVVWLGGIALALIPWYAKLLGPQQWGLVAVCISLQGIMALLDAGLTQVMPRDIARAFAHSKEDGARTFHVFSRAYLVLGAIGCVLGQVAAPWIAVNWLRATPEIMADATWALRIVLLQFLFQFSNNAHIGYWNGTQAQATANFRQCLFVSAKHVGALTLINFWQESVLAYLLSFAIFSALEYFSNRGYLMRKIGQKGCSSVGLLELIALARDSGVMAASVFVGMLISQMDRIVLSGYVSVAEFGRYVIVANLGLAFMQLQHPLVRAFLPKLVTAASGSMSNTIQQMGVSLVVLCVLPCMVVAVLAPQVLSLWIGDPTIVQEGTVPLRLILVAVAFNGLYQIVYQRMLVYGLAGSILKINIIILVFVFPLSIFCVTKYGINGGGMIWVTVSVLQIILGLFFTKKC